jgi:hypothetical protein
MGLHAAACDTGSLNLSSYVELTLFSSSYDITLIIGLAKFRNFILLKQHSVTLARLTLLLLSPKL